MVLEELDSSNSLGFSFLERNNYRKMYVDINLATWELDGSLGPVILNFWRKSKEEEDAVGQERYLLLISFLVSGDEMTHALIFG